MVNFKTEYVVGVQQSVTLNCQAEGNLPPTYTWIPCNDPEQLCNKETRYFTSAQRCQLYLQSGQCTWS